MDAIDEIKAKGLPYQDDESGLIRLAILDLAARLDEAEKRIDAHIGDTSHFYREVDAKPQPEQGWWGRSDDDAQ